MPRQVRSIVSPDTGMVELISELTPIEFHDRRPFKTLTAIDPCERFHLAASGETSMRIVDLVAPIGKGTRGLIVAPSKAGKTTLLEQMTKAIHAGNPGTRIIVLLIDERPEEVTYFRRAVTAEVFSSSSDQSMKEHVELVEMTLAHIRTDLECGRDVVVLVDSLTRMGRVFNQKGSGSGRTLSGGMEAGALEFPRRFFGLARNIEDGGSITIMATALVDTGSRMDEVIFEEFKGTGNMELVLDRRLTDRRIFPSIELNKSGTRKEELLLSREELSRVWVLRKLINEMNLIEGMEFLLEKMRETRSNKDFLQSMNS